ncbi:MAG: RNA polymerase subunit sigma [Planctomycetes bacterium]|nr:RNA polymerase subunit sigma [Planctomycetota bacterium]MCD7897814.1 NAD-dependent protein deacylase [Planctomycetaceae bacterium]
MPFHAITPEQCADKIRDAGHIAVLSGAGLSTAAGVPDFRGPNGLYVTRQYDPEKVFDISGFNRDPEPFFDFSRDFLAVLDDLRPTFAHRFLAALEGNGHDVAVITQNIDGLHQRAGSRRVYPMHGDYQSAHCRRCGREYAGPDIVRMIQETAIPTCHDCGAVVKPDVVFFGENVRHLDTAYDQVGRSDLLLVLGSSLTVYPAAALPEQAGGEVVIVNQGEVGIRPFGTMYLADANLDEFFKGVAEALGMTDVFSCEPPETR